MIDPELKKKWVDALRSGDYTQTSNCLRDENGFCCLGVLADVNGVKWEWEEGNEYGQDTFVFYSELYGEEKQYDTDVPWEWLKRDTASTLINMNDGNEAISVRKHSFSEIADYIENSVDI